MCCKHRQTDQNRLTLLYTQNALAGLIYYRGISDFLTTETITTNIFHMSYSDVRVQQDPEEYLRDWLDKIIMVLPQNVSNYFADIFTVGIQTYTTCGTCNKTTSRYLIYYIILSMVICTRLYTQMIL